MIFLPIFSAADSDEASAVSAADSVVSEEAAVQEPISRCAVRAYVLRCDSLLKKQYSDVRRKLRSITVKNVRTVTEQDPKQEHSLRPVPNARDRAA